MSKEGALKIMRKEGLKEEAGRKRRKLKKDSATVSMAP